MGAQPCELGWWFKDFLWCMCTCIQQGKYLNLANNLNGFNSAIYMHNYFVYKYIVVSGDDNK